MTSGVNDTYAIFLPAKNIPVGLYVLLIGELQLMKEYQKFKMPTVDDSLSEVLGRQNGPSQFQLPRVII